MTRTRWIIFAVACALLLGILVVNSKKDAVNVSSVDPNAIITTGDGTDHVYGDKNSKVIVFEYGDFQCPACGAAYPQLKTIKETYKNNIAFVFRNFPLTTLHPNALAAATVAGAAAQQGKFWEMHNALYENRSSWENLSTTQRGDAFRGYAKQIGLDMDQFNKDLSSSAVSNKIASDRAIGAKINVDSTPTIYVNGEKMPTEVINDLVRGDGKLFVAKINDAIKATGGTVPTAQQQ